MARIRVIVASCVVLCACLAGESLGAGYTYPVAISGPVTDGGPGTGGTIDVVGTIMVDQLGPVTLGNILDWELQVSSPSTASNTLTPANSDLYLQNPDIMATTAGLTLTVNGSANPVKTVFQLDDNTPGVMRNGIQFVGGDTYTPIQWLHNWTTHLGPDYSSVDLGTTNDVAVVLSTGSVWYTYDVSVSGPATTGGPGDVVATGSITAKKLGPLAVGDIADWALTISSANAPDMLLTPDNSTLALSSGDLVATAADLTFNVRGTNSSSDSLFVLIDDLLASELYTLKLQGGDGRDAKQLLHNQPTLSSGDVSVVLLGSGGDVPVVIGVIPEPATLSLLALGGLAMLRRRRK